MEATEVGAAAAAGRCGPLARTEAGALWPQSVFWLNL